MNYIYKIILLIFILLIFVHILFYLRLLRYNRNNECEEEIIINKQKKACCGNGKCEIKDI